MSPEVCPWNTKFAQEAAEPGYVPAGVEEVAPSGDPHPGTDSPSLIALLEMALSESA